MAVKRKQSYKGMFLQFLTWGLIQLLSKRKNLKIRMKIMMNMDLRDQQKRLNFYRI